MLPAGSLRRPAGCTRSCRRATASPFRLSWYPSIHAQPSNAGQSRTRIKRNLIGRVNCTLASRLMWSRSPARRLFTTGASPAARPGSGRVPRRFVGTSRPGGIGGTAGPGDSRSPSRPPAPRTAPRATGSPRLSCPDSARSHRWRYGRVDHLPEPEKCTWFGWFRRVASHPHTPYQLVLKMEVQIR